MPIMVFSLLRTTIDSTPHEAQHPDAKTRHSRGIT